MNCLAASWTSVQEVYLAYFLQEGYNHKKVKLREKEKYVSEDS